MRLFAQHLPTYPARETAQQDLMDAGVTHVWLTWGGEYECQYVMGAYALETDADANVDNRIDAPDDMPWCVHGPFEVR